jgi:hypothetical protein
MIVVGTFTLKDILCVPMAIVLADIVPIEVDNAPTEPTPAPAPAAAKKVVVAPITGVVKVLPVPNDDPPVDAEYQFTEAPVVTGVASKITVPEPQREAGVVVAIKGFDTTTVSKGSAHTVPLPSFNCKL